LILSRESHVARSPSAPPGWLSRAVRLEQNFQFEPPVRATYTLFCFTAQQFLRPELHCRSAAISKSTTPRSPIIWSATKRQRPAPRFTFLPNKSPLPDKSDYRPCGLLARYRNRVNRDSFTSFRMAAITGATRSLDLRRCLL
jgi:hypothetical protein